MDCRPYQALSALLLLTCAARADDTAGFWLGVIGDGDVRFRIALRLTRSVSGELSGKLDSVDQGIMNAPVDKIRMRGNALHFEVKSFRAVFDGAQNGDEIAGRWKQKEGAVMMVFRRTDRLRRQDPVPPLPYTSEEVTFENSKAGVRLAGTLTLPHEPRPAPAALLISGSGAGDRDASTAGHRPFRVLADALTRRGIAVLRVDARGVGGSTGHHDDAALDDLTADALAAFQYLKTRPEIDGRRIGMLGHSEGGLVAPLAAQRAPDIAFVVLLAAPAVPGEQMLLDQSFSLPRLMGIPEEIAARHRDAHRAMFEILKQESDNAAARKKLLDRINAMKGQLPPEMLARLHAESATMTSAPFRAFLAYDPRPALTALRVPVLAVAGELDPLVPAATNLPEMARALKTEYRIAKLPGLNHLLQPASNGSPMEYAGIETTMAPAALDLIGGWIVSGAGFSLQPALAGVRK